MGEPLPRKKSKLLTWTVVAIIAIIITSVVLYFLYMEHLDTLQLSDPENDVVLSVGTQYPGMIDVVGASLEANGTTLKVTIDVRDLISNVGDREYAQWNVTVILENETDVLRTYEVSVDMMNSTQLTGYIVNVETQNVQSCQVEQYQKSLTVLAVIDDLQSAKTIEWNILTTYEEYYGNELIISASDMAPDQALQETALKPSNSHFFI